MSSSYLEIYLTLLGWLQYANLYEILVATRLIYVPIIFLIITNITGPIISQEAKNAVLVATRRMLIQVIFIIVLLISAFVPYLPLSSTILEYNKPCPTAYGEAGAVQAGNTGTSYDAQFQVLVTTDIRVPIWWRLFMSISAGVTRAAIANIGCITDLSGYQIRIETQKITDNAVATQLKQFVQYCYQPAISKIERDGDSTTTLAIDTTDPLSSDLTWIGSPVFIETDGYYNTFRAGQGISGWSYSASRDTDYTPAEVALMESTENVGRPRCDEWWVALRALILINVEPDLLTQVRSELPIAFGGLTPEQVDELVLRSVVSNSFLAAPAASALIPSFNDENSLASYGSRTLAGLGLDFAELGLRPVMYAVKAALPIIQAYILMSIYTLIGVIIVISGLSFRAVIVTTVTIFVVKFWSYLWFLTWWIENNLFAAMFPNGEGYAMGSAALLLGQTYLVGGDFALKVNIIEFVTLFMYLIFPVIFAVLLAGASVWATQNASTFVASLSGPIQSGAGKVVSTLKGASRGAISGGVNKNLK